MCYPVLIAQTPRAGRWHCLNLLPRDAPPDLRVAEYLAAASARAGGDPPGPADLVGGNYIAVADWVTQPTTGRPGLEILALVGLNVPSDPERESIVRQLRDRLPALGAWVGTYDWDRHDGADLPCDELGRWQAELVRTFHLRPHPHRTHRPLAGHERVHSWECLPGWNRGWIRRLYGAAVGLLLLAAVGTVGVMVWYLLRTPGDPRTTEKSPQTEPTPTPNRPAETPPGWDAFLETSRSTRQPQSAC